MTISESMARETQELPLVCICVPTYNAAGTVRETLESILSQRYSNLVVHISDNASTDDTLQVIEAMADSRVTIHRHAENVGGEANFNRCIQLAEGKYTAIFHADDVYEPDMLAKQVAFLEANPGAGAVFTAASTIDEMGRRIGEIGLPKDVVSQDGLYDFSTMLKAVLRHSNFFICSCVMARTKVYQEEIKCWRGELFKSSADLDVWLRILQRHSVGYLQEALLRYRISSGQFSALVRQRIERADFFLVTDYYLAQEQVRALLSDKDLRNIGRLERRDRVMRAVNLLNTNRSAEIKAILHDIGSWDALTAAVKTKRGFSVLILGMYVKLLTVLRVEYIGKAPLSYLKRVTRR